MKRFFTIALLFTGLICYSQIWPWEKEKIWDTISFETSYPYLIINSDTQNIWQIAEPNKSLFNSAYDSNKVIITDSINFYPVENHSYFDLYIGNFNNEWYMGNNFIEFKHKFDTDSLKDGGYITYSIDLGTTWYSIVPDTGSYFSPPEYDNFYSENDTLFNGEHGFSGKSDGWITTTISWYAIPIKSQTSEGDTMILRFNFISDSIDNHMEGWMIDEIILYSIHIGGDVRNNDYNNQVQLFPNPVKNVLNLSIAMTYSKVAIEIIDIQGKTRLVKHLIKNQTPGINLDQLPEGIYFAKIKIDEDKPVNKKFIIKRN